MSTSSALPVAETSPPELAAGPASGARWGWAVLGLVPVGAAAAFLHWDALVAAATTWIRSPTYSYGLLVPPVVAFLLWRRRGALQQIAPRPWPWGLALLAAAALVATVGKVISALAVEQLAFVLILQAAALTILGPGVFRWLAFPLFYLFLAVPIGDGLIAPLQAFTARFAVGVLAPLGVPVRLDGLLIHIPGATFHVAEACAGLRFLLAAVAIGVLVAHLCFRSWWHHLAFVLLSIALAIVGNGLRAAGVVWIAHLSDLDLAKGVDHLTYGYAFTALLLACLVGLAAVLGRPGPGRFDVPAPAPVKAARAGIAATAAAALLATTLPALAARAAVAGCQGHGSTVPASPFPEIAGPWTPAEGDAAWRPAAANPDAEFRQRYRRDDQSIDLYVAWYCTQREGAEAVSQGHRLAGGAPWTVRGLEPDRLVDGAGAWPVQRLDVGSGVRGRLVFVWYWVDGRFTADPVAAKLLQAKAALFGGPAAAALVVASAPYQDDPALARAAVAEALVALEPLDGFLRRLGRPVQNSVTP